MFRKIKSDVTLSFVFYAVGLFAFLCTDIIVVQNFTEDNIAEWAFLKSIILIFGSICLLGYDLVFIRDISLINRFFKRFNVQTIIITTLLCVLLFLIRKYTINRLFFIFIAVYLCAIINYISAGYRANFNLYKSQLSGNLWKILLVFGIVIFVFSDVILFFVLALFVSTIILIICLKPISFFYNIPHSIIIGDKDAVKLGNSFLITNITLILATYGEQFLINLTDNVNVSSNLFTYFAVFTPIALSMNGFIGFYYGPKVRKDNDMTLGKYKKFTMMVFLYSIVITCISILCGTVYMHFFRHTEIIELDFLLILSLSILCIIRGVYISTSVCLGVFGKQKFLRNAAFWNIFFAVLYICMVFLILNIPINIYTVVLISCASTFNWLMRLIVSNVYTVKSLKKQNQ